MKRTSVPLIRLSKYPVSLPSCFSSPLSLLFKSSSSLQIRHSTIIPTSFPSRPITTHNNKNMKIYFHSDYHVNLPEGHRFPMERYLKTYSLLCSRIGISETVIQQFLKQPSSATTSLEGNHITISPSILATKEECLLAHSSEYIEAYTTGNLTKDQEKRIGFPWSQEFVNRTLRITGGTIQSSLQALSTFPSIGSISGNMAGGTHHAFRDHGEGFCIFNDIAVSIKVLQLLTLYQYHSSQYNNYHLQSSSLLLLLAKIFSTYPSISPVYRVGVLDLDVHQGNGTAGIFHNDPSVITVSMHGEKNYPWSTRYPSIYDVDVPDQCTDEIYLAELDKTLDIFDGLIRLSDKDIQLISEQNILLAQKTGIGKEVLPSISSLHHDKNNNNNSTPRSLRNEALPIVIANKTSASNIDTASSPTSSSSFVSSSSISPSPYLQYSQSTPLIYTLAKQAKDSNLPIRIQALYYQAGVDPLVYDRLGRLQLTRSGLFLRNEKVYRWAEERNLPVIVTMGGGYSKPIEKSTECHTDVFLQAAASYRRRKQKYEEMITSKGR